MVETNKEFEFCGVNHLALVCKDMAKTVEFYRDILGMPLVKTLDLPGGNGQHFFFDVGNGDCIAFFWFPNAPEAVPGISAPEALPTKGNFMSAHGSMNHIAINIPAERFDEYYDRLVEKGVEVTKKLNHDNSPTQASEEMNDDVYVRSVYFFDPDGVCLEFAAWTKVFDESDVAHDPVQADGTKREGFVTGRTAVPAE
ncbi:VOC family protein [Parasphingorhabdus sp. JC815]|uniref:VOC family protein n=1 Tax=Parasphingorhabdus sp. JC815 TaxID=3232140 RepID=UPI00345A925A